MLPFTIYSKGAVAKVVYCTKKQGFQSENPLLFYWFHKAFAKSRSFDTAPSHQYLNPYHRRKLRHRAEKKDGVSIKRLCAFDSSRRYHIKLHNYADILCLKESTS